MVCVCVCVEVAFILGRLTSGRLLDFMKHHMSASIDAWRAQACTRPSFVNNAAAAGKALRPLANALLLVWFVVVRFAS